MESTMIASTKQTGGIARENRRRVQARAARMAVSMAARSRQGLSAALAVMLAVLLVGLPQRVKADSCTFTQITSAAGDPRSNVPAISANGTRIAFLSRADLTGGNPDGNREVFLFDMTSNSLTQITTSAGAPVAAGAPSINADGTRIVFSHNGDLTGGNADGNFEIFLYDTIAGLSQITSTQNVFTVPVPSINANGTRIAFHSSADLTGGNPDEGAEIFLYDTASNILTQITSSTVPTLSPTINADGTRIAFLSTADLTGGNADGSPEVFLYDTTSNSLTQITSSLSPSIFASFTPAINADGTRIAFAWQADLTGGNPDGNIQVFLYDTTANSLTQITSSAGVIHAGYASINADGTRIAFESIADLTGGNPDGNIEVFLYDTTSNSLTQITSSTVHSSRASINADGTRIAFGSFADLTGGNPDGSEEIFLATCRRDSDGDGLPDDIDPDTVAVAVMAIPLSAFQAPGSPNAVVSRLDNIEQDILAGDIAGAIKQLRNLRKRVDGCGQTADNNDWIKDCPAQIQIRALIDTLITNLGG